MAKIKKHKKLVIGLSITGGVLLSCFVAFSIYCGIYNHATDNALTYLKDSSNSTVKDEKSYVTFTPKENSKDSGLIFYPGGKVDYKAYAPFLRDLSDSGYGSVLVKMPLNLAVFKPNGADGKQALIPSISHWYISGHSLGGAMTCSYLGSHQSEYDGVILLAAYSTVDLTGDSSFKSLSLLAENDKVLNWNKYESSKKNLPNLTEVTIKGGIHSYFGDYGIQRKDGTPTITVEEQRKEVVSSIVSFLS